MELQHALQKPLGMVGPQLKTVMTRSTTRANYMESIKNEESLWSKCRAVLLSSLVIVCQSYERVSDSAVTKMI